MLIGSELEMFEWKSNWEMSDLARFTHSDELFSGHMSSAVVVCMGNGYGMVRECVIA